MRRSVVRLGVLAIPLVLAVACGKGGGKGKSDAEDAPQEQPPANPPPPPPNPPPADPAKPPVPGVYQMTNTPPKFALTLPGALLIDTGSPLCLQGEDECGDDGMVFDEEDAYADPEEDAPDAEAPSGSESHGMSELGYQLEGLQSKIVELTGEFIVVDQVLEANKADCADGCTIQNAKAKLTHEMINLMFANGGGEDEFDAKERQSLMDAIGVELDIGTVVVTHPTDDKHGYTTFVEITGADGDVSIFAWSTDFHLVRVERTHAGEWEEESETAGAAPTIHKFNIAFDFLFDATKGFLGVKDKSDHDGYKNESTFTFSVDAENAASNGLAFNVRNESSAPGEDGSFTDINGFADDTGAYLRTEYSFDDFNTVLTPSAALGAGQYYGIFPAGTVLADLTANDEAYYNLMLGSMMGDGSFTPVDAYYSGPDGADFPAGGLPLFTETYAYDEATDEASRTIALADLTLLAAAVSKTRTTAGYEEIIDLTGKVTSFCYYPAGNFTDMATRSCSGEISGKYLDEFTESAGGDGEIDVGGELRVGVNDVFFSAVNGASLYIIRDTAELSADSAMAALNAALLTTDEADDDAAWMAVIGNGNYIGEDAESVDSPSTTPINDFYEFSFWGTLDEGNAAGLAQIQYDDDGNPRFTMVPGADVVAWVVDSANADKDVETVVDEVDAASSEE